MPDATSGDSIEEQLVRDVDRGTALLGRYLLDQLGQPCGEVSRQIHKPLGATDRGNFGNHVFYRGIADRRDLIIWLHSHATPSGQDGTVHCLIDIRNRPVLTAGPVLALGQGAPRTRLAWHK